MTKKEINVKICYTFLAFFMIHLKHKNAKEGFVNRYDMQGGFAGLEDHSP